MSELRKIGTIKVDDVRRELAQHAELWNQRPERTQPGSPHAGVDDIWVRYADIHAPGFDWNQPYECQWFPPADVLPSVKEIVRLILDRIPGTLGGVLLTRVPARDAVLPHTDEGWHARSFQKYAVQIDSNEQQCFCTEEHDLVTLPGDVYTFNNQVSHWVENNSDEPRVTLIVCIKGE